MTLIVLDTFAKVALFSLLINVCVAILGWLVEGIEYRFGQKLDFAANFLITATLSFTTVISALGLGLIR